MKVLAVGIGQCGNRIADEFARLNNKARSQRGIEIVTGVFAVNTDAADLTGLRTIGHDYQHRILIGGRTTGGHGVGKINELAAEIAREDADKVVDAIRTAKRFFESDAFFLIAGAAGGTGSGSIAIMARHIKERYGSNKPVYAILILPFEHEETSEVRTLFNTATCLKSTYAVADAVFLIDNQRYVKKDFSLKSNVSKINEMIAGTFYNLLCSGEEKKSKYVGTRLLDAGDIAQTLSGWTAIGYGETQVPLFRFPWFSMRNFIKKSTETHRGMQAMDEALIEMSLKCNPADSRKALYLLSAPAKEMNMDLVKDLGEYLRRLAPQAIIRNGDYPREKGILDVTVVLSQLEDVEKVKSYYSRSADYITSAKRREQEFESKLKEIEDTGKDLPSLL